jgi:hypothetical protein
MDQARDDGRDLQRVRCLNCGTTYTKPMTGGIVQMNPGCPRCCYAGWLTVSGRGRPLRSVEGPPPPPSD